MQGSRDYMNISLANRADERNRARQLEDRAAAEAGEERRFQRGVMTAREERKLAQDEAFQAAVIQALVNEGFLQPSDAGNPDAVAQAYTRASESGLIKRYEQLITAGLLKPDEVGDQTKVNAALEQLGSTNLQTTQNASAEVTRLRDEGAQINAQMQELGARLAEPARMPSNAQIQSRAVQLAQQAKPGKTPSEADIQSFMPQAAEELTQMAQQEKFLRDNTASQERQLLYSRARDLQQRQENLERSFRVAPAPAPAAPVAPMSTPTSSAPRQATAEERAAAMAAAIRATNPNSGSMAEGSAPSRTYENTFSDPEIQAYNDRQEAAVLVNRVRPLQEARQSAEQRARMAQAGIERLKASPGSSNAMNPSLVQSTNQYGIPAPQANQYGVPFQQPPSDNRVAELNRLYTELQKAEQEKTEAEKQLAEFESSARRGARPAMTKTSPVVDPVFAPPNQTPAFQSRLSMAPAM